MDYQETLKYISSTNWKGSVPGLERIRELTAMLGNPQDKLKFIHVGGSNGKGSVCAFLSSILVNAGYRVGLFISPYIEVFNERMQINNVNISDEELAEITTYIRPFADSMEDSPTEFELNTAIAFEYFSRHECDIVVLEVGMGGELDSTNIILPPELAVITTISLEHTQYLGNTLEEIATTKSGIIKSGCNVVLYKQASEVTETIRRRCALVGAELYISEPEAVETESVSIDRQVLHHRDFGDISIALLGRYQSENAAVVLKAVEVLKNSGYNITDGAVRKGFADTRWPGRFEVISREPVFIVDGAHNPQGARATSDSMDSVFMDEKLIMIIGVLADKDYREMLGYLLPHAREVMCVSPPSERALASERTAEVVNSMGVKAQAFDDIGDAIEAAFDRAGRTVPICAVGSLYMVGDIKRYVNNREKREYI